MGLTKKDSWKPGRLAEMMAIGLILAGGVWGESAVLAPESNRRADDFRVGDYGKNLDKLMADESAAMRARAAEQYKRVREVNQQGKWKPNGEAIDGHQAPEWFKDAKFGMFIDWGLWSVAGWAPQKEAGAMYPDWYEFRLDTDPEFRAYHEANWGTDFKRDDFIPLFQARDYRPERLAEIAKLAGMKYIVPFCKHHGGFCLWPSSFTRRDAGDMGPKRDLIGPLVESCRANGLKFGFYFSIEEWEYPIIGADGQLMNRDWGGQPKPYRAELESKCSGKIAVKDFAADYLIPQATEFIDRYDPDLLWYDGDWSTNVEKLGSYEIAAYFYNRAQGRKEVVVNDRYGGHPGQKWQRSIRGDFFTNEYGDMEKEAKQARHAWEECRGISQSFGYNWQDTESNVITSKAFIDQFVDIVAHGGNLLLIVNLDGQGGLPKVQENRLRDIGQWLAVNGEGIYATRPHAPYLDGRLAYTQSKDGRTVYAILKQWPGAAVTLKGVRPAAGGKVQMLGYGPALEWTQAGDTIRITIPAGLQEAGSRPCEHAWVFKVDI